MVEGAGSRLITRCILHSGRIVQYDMCGDVGVPYTLERFEYLGDGRVYSIGELRQGGNTILSFYRYRDEYRKVLTLLLEGRGEA